MSSREANFTSKEDPFSPPNQWKSNRPSLDPLPRPLTILWQLPASKSDKTNNFTYRHSSIIQSQGEVCEKKKRGKKARKSLECCNPL